MSGRKFFNFLKGIPKKISRMDARPESGAEGGALPRLVAEICIESVEAEPKVSPQDEGATAEAARGKAELEEEQEEEQEEEEAEAETEAPGDQQFLTLKARLSAETKAALTSKTPLTHLIIVADTSSSMTGPPWTQVQQGLLEIIPNSLARKHIVLDLVCYDNDARQVDFTPENYRDIINYLRPSGRTGFVSAFTTITQVIERRKETRDFQKVVVVFMTDGEETVNTRDSAKEALQQWQQSLKAMPVEVVVHCLGFSRNHDYDFLSSLCLNGMFRYCEPTDGPDALQAKMGELYQYILGAMLRVRVSISAEQHCQFVTGKGLQTATELQAEIKEDSDGGLPVVTAESWIRASSSEIPQFTVSILGEVQVNEEEKTVSIPCEVKVTQKVVEGMVEKAFWAMRIVDYFATQLTERLNEALKEKKDASKLNGRLQRLHKQLSNIPIVNPKITKEDRERLLVTHADIQSKLDILQKLLANLARGETSSVSMLARMHDLRYDAQFSKARRQRMMERRAMSNIAGVMRDQERLDRSFVNEEEVKRLSPEALDFFFCALAQCSIKDILLDSSDNENCIGFGLAVRRPEHAMDDPTQILLQVISGTLVSRTSMLDAIEHKISVDGQLGAHAGFSFYLPLGVATVGTSREPINAWLPLYVTPTHWHRVRLLLKPMLAFFCTLDPLGYSHRQMNIMFTVLGQMIGRLAKETLGEHQLRLLFAVQRTCAAIVQDFYLERQLEQAITEFRDAPNGRTKDRVPNLFTLVGYLAAMSPATARRLLGLEDGDKTKLYKFWLAFLLECLRRASGSTLKDKSDKEAYGLLNVLINGSEPEVEGSVRREPTGPCSALRDLAQVVVQEGLTTLTAPVFDPVGESMVPDLPLTNSAKMDKAMERWAESQYSDQPPKNKDKLKEAKKEIRRWLEDIVKTLGVTPSDMPDPASDKKPSQQAEEQKAEEEKAEAEPVQEEFEDDDFNPYSPPPSSLDFMAQMLHVLTPHCMPSPQAVPAFMAFMQWWLQSQHRHEDLDSSSGLAPDDWVQAAKQVMADMQQRVAAFEASMREEPAEAHKKSAPQATGVGSEEEATITEETAMEVAPEETAVVSEESPVGVVPDAEAAAASAKGGSGGAPEAGPQADGGDGEDEDDDDDDNDSFGEDGGIDFFDLDFDVAPMYEMPKVESSRAGHFAAFLAALQMLLAEEEAAGAGATKDEELVALLRAALCQAVLYRSNALARSAIENDRFKDLIVKDNAVAVLLSLYRELQKKKAGAGVVKASRNFWALMSHRMQKAETMWAFIGYLNHTFTDRSEGYKIIFNDLINCPDASKIPLLAEKIRLLLLAKYNDKPIFAKGNIYYPDSNVVKKISKAIGEEAWIKIQLVLREGVQIHVYRESDIPNRHDHCNSSPYIPNEIRKQLGMPLMPDVEPVGRWGYRHKRH